MVGSGSVGCRQRPARGAVACRMHAAMALPLAVAASQLVAGSLLIAASLLIAVPTFAFDLDDVAAKAKALAAQPYQDPTATVPDWLAKLSYDQWRDIRFKPERAMWRDRGLPFEVQFFHPGLYYDRIVALNEVDANGVRPIPFSPGLFDFNRCRLGSRSLYQACE